MTDELYPGFSAPELKEIFSERELQIMEAALEVFTDKGYASASTREIAERAGIAEGTIFRYFKTKKDILFRLASTLFEKLIIPFVLKQVEIILIEHRSKPLEELIPMLIKDRISLIRANSRYIQLFAYELQFHEEFKQNFLSEIITKAAHMVTEFLEEKQREGLIRPEVNCQMAVFSLVGMTGVFILLRDFFHAETKFAFTDDEIATHITRIFLNGVKA